MKCDICCNDSPVGFKHRLTVYENKPTLFRKRWRVVKRHKTVFVCKKCMDILTGLVRNYRKERVI